MQKSDNNYAKKILKWKTNKPQILSMVSKIQIIFGAKPHKCKKVQNSSTQIHAIVSKMTDFFYCLCRCKEYMGKFYRSNIVTP